MTTEQIQQAQAEFSAARAALSPEERHDSSASVPANRPNLAAVARIRPSSSAVKAAIGQTPSQAWNVLPGQKIIDTINQARPGDTVNIAAGTFNESVWKITANGITIQGAFGKNGDPSTFVKFNTGGAFAVTLPSPANGIIIDGIMLENNGGLFLANGGTVDLMISRCGLKFDNSGSNAVGLRSLSGNLRLTVSRCLFHDSPHGWRDMDLWDTTDCIIDSNEFDQLGYGAHVCGTHINLRWTNNRGRGYGDMGVEIQDFGVTHGVGSVIYSGNCYYGWSNRCNNNSFGNSLPVQFTGTLLNEDNYIAAGDWDENGKYVEQKLDHGTHLGYGSENAASKSCIIRRNISIGSWCMSIVTATDAEISDCKSYGVQMWGDHGTEHGNLAQGKYTKDTNNQGDLPIETAPRPPKPITRTPWRKTSTPPPPPDNTMNLNALRGDPNDTLLAVTNIPAGAKVAVQIDVPDGGTSGINGRGTKVGLFNLDASNQVNLQGLAVGWNYTATAIIAGTSAGWAAVAFKTTGSPSSDYVGGAASRWAGSLPVAKTVTQQPASTVHFEDSGGYDYDPATNKISNDTRKTTATVKGQ